MHYSNTMKGQNNKTIFHGSPNFNHKNPKPVVAKTPKGRLSCVVCTGKVRYFFYRDSINIYSCNFVKVNEAVLLIN